MTKRQWTHDPARVVMVEVDRDEVREKRVPFNWNTAVVVRSQSRDEWTHAVAFVLGVTAAAIAFGVAWWIR
jgi:hypothetical protein